MVRHPKFTKEEFARRGDALYESVVRPYVEPGDNGKFVAIDVESGEYELADDDYAATQRLLGRKPKAQVWLVRVGAPYVHRLGRGTNVHRS